MNKTGNSLLLCQLAAFAVMSSTAGANAADDAGSLFKQAEDMLGKNKPKNAAVLLRQIVKSDPRNAEAHALLGQCLAAQVEDQNYDAAIAEEKEAIKLDPKSFAARKTLGKIYANQQKHDEAIAMLKEACALKPDSYAGQKDLGTAFLSAGKNDDAIDSFKKALVIKPSSVECHVKLAVLLSKKGDHANAITEAREAVKLNGKQAEIHLALANILLESGDLKGSIEPYKDAIAANGYDSLGCLNPLTAASAFSGLGWAIGSQKDASKEQIEEGVRDQKKAIKAYPTFLTAYVRLGDFLTQQQKPKEAESVYQRGLSMSRGDAAIAVPYAKFLDYRGRNSEGVALLKKVLEKSPGNKQAAEALAALEHKKA